VPTIGNFVVGTALCLTFGEARTRGSRLCPPYRFFG
jgi:hypothetical protein